MICSNQMVSDLSLVFLQDSIRRSVLSDTSLETKLIFEVVDVEGGEGGRKNKTVWKRMREYGEIQTTHSPMADDS